MLSFILELCDFMMCHVESLGSHRLRICILVKPETSQLSCLWKCILHLSPFSLFGAPVVNVTTFHTSCLSSAYYFWSLCFSIVILVMSSDLYQLTGHISWLILTSLVTDGLSQASIKSSSIIMFQIKRCLVLIRIAMTNLDSVLKSRDINLPTKFHIVKAVVFPVIMYGCENWTIKKAEHWRINAFELRCWRRLLRVPWTASRSNQSILKEINPKYSLEGLMLKLQYFGHLFKELIHWKGPLSWERWRAGAEKGHRGWDSWMASLTQWTWVWANSVIWWKTGNPGMLQSMA